MPDQLPASEYGGKINRKGIQPHPHVPTPSEQLSLTYRTGDRTGNTNPDNGEAFSGILPLAEQVKLKQAKGEFNKGEIWNEMVNSPQYSGDV